MFAAIELPRVAVIVRDVPEPEHDTVMPDGSIIVHDKVPVDISVVDGTIILNWPLDGIEFILVENTDNVVVALTVLTKLWTPTFERVPHFALFIHEQNNMRIIISANK